MKLVTNSLMASDFSYMSHIDIQLKSFFSHINIQEISTSCIISNINLERMHYFDKFPHYITHLDFSGKINSGEISSAGYCLSPAACLNVYPLYEGTFIEKPELITLLQRVYRKENSYDPGTRFFEFTVREFVIIGSEDYVLEVLDSISEKILAWVRTYCDDAQLEYAVDNFYPTRQNKILAAFQTNKMSKREIVVPFNTENISLCSFNFHGTTFSQEYNFHSGGIVTGCIGFGLERWLTFLKGKEYRIGT